MSELQGHRGPALNDASEPAFEAASRRQKQKSAGKQGSAREAAPRRARGAQSGNARVKPGMSEQVAKASSGVLMRLWTGTKVLSGVLVVLGAALALAWGLQRYALTTPRFAVQKIDISGTKRRSTDQLLKLAQIQRGDNLFSIDVQVAERRLLEDPWVAQAKVERRIPATLAISVEEREAVALASIDGELYLLGKDGAPFKQLEEGDPRDLPVLTGISAADINRDRARQVDRFAVGIQVLRQYARIPMSRVHAAQEVHLAEDGSVTLTIGKSGVALHLGKGPWRSKLLMAWRVMGNLSERGRLPRIVFLDNQAHPERVVVRMK